MHRHMELVEGLHQPFQTVGEDDGRSSIGQQGGAGDEADDAHRHDNGIEHTLIGDADKAELEQDIAVHKEHIQYTGKDNEHDHRLDALEHHFDGNAGDLVAAEDKQGGNCHSLQIACQEQFHNIDRHEDDLAPGVHPVDGAGPREVLPDGDVFKHGDFPPFGSVPGSGPQRPPPGTHWD